MIVICTAVHNRRDTAIPYLESLSYLTHAEPFRLSFFDWGSTDCDYSDILNRMAALSQCSGTRIEVRYRREERALEPYNRSAARWAAYYNETPAQDDIVVFLDADMLVPPDFLDRVKATVKPGTAYFPICYSLHEGKPAKVRGDRREGGRANGWWRQRGFGNCAFVTQDYIRLGGWPDWVEKWGGEDTELWEQARKQLKVVRPRCPGLFHQWHPPAFTPQDQADYENGRPASLRNVGFTQPAPSRRKRQRVTRSTSKPGRKPNGQQRAARKAEVTATLENCKTLLQSWVDKQGHDRCWYYPEIFNELCKLLGVTPTTTPGLPPREEFAEGCRKYAEDEYKPKPLGKMEIDPEWLKRMAEKEDGCPISVGGLAVKLGLPVRPPEPPLEQPPICDNCGAFTVPKETYFLCHNCGNSMGATA